MSKRRKFNRQRVLEGMPDGVLLYEPPNAIKLIAIQDVTGIIFGVRFIEHEKHEITKRLTIHYGVKIKLDYVTSCSALCSPIHYEDFRDQVEPHIKNDTRKHNGIRLTIMFDDLEEYFLEAYRGQTLQST